jgi:UDP-N-acetylmuramoyl-tripeptide--D-alanyl-D-alanine ligase
MEPRTLQYLAEACQGELIRGEPTATVSRVSTDSRQVQPGDLFIALNGIHFDGHDFLPEAASAGAGTALVERDRADAVPEGCAVIAVDNTRTALGRLAARYRKDFELPIVAIGGSNGKTSTKELLAAVMRKRFKTLWSEASFNNDIGVPLTLLKLDNTHTAAVVEVGTNHPGELKPLLDMIRPRFGVITSLGREHLEFFGDMNGVAEEESHLAQALPPNGVLFANGDCLGMEWIIRRSRARAVRVGMGVANDWRGRLVVLDEVGTTFGVRAPHPLWCGGYRINLLGRHQVINAMLALAVGAELGLLRAEILCGLASCRPIRMRMQLWRAQGVRVLDDAYNANVDSMLAALQTLRDLPCNGRRVAVLGDMAELGGQTEACHAEIGRRAAELGIHHLFAVGQMAAVTCHAAQTAGLQRVTEFVDVDSATRAMKEFLREGDVVLLKASRTARLERIREALVEEGQPEKEQKCFTI